MTEYFRQSGIASVTPKAVLGTAGWSTFLVDKKAALGHRPHLVSIYGQALSDTDRIDILNVQATTFGAGGTP